MKKIFPVLLGLLSFVMSFSQVDSTLPPYKKFPTFPPFKMRMPDSSFVSVKELLPKKSPVLLMLFNPECSHCQHETEELISHMESFKEVQIVMATPMPYDSMMAFRQRYHLTEYKNIMVGQDEQFMLPTYFMISNLPFLAFYTAKKELIDTFEGSMPIEKVIDKFRK